MKIYMASLHLKTLKEYHKRFPNEKLNVLRSFNGRDKNEFHLMNTHRDKIDSLIFDSGAYTKNYAQNSGFNITIDTYKDYLLSNEKYFDFYFNLDEDFTNNGFGINYENQLSLEDVGLKPVPVIHNIYSDEADVYIKNNYKIVAIGSAQIKNSDPEIIRPVVEKLYDNEICVHLFGTTSYKLLVNLPIFSCDASTYALNSAFGNIFYWNPSKSAENKTDNIYLEEYYSDKNKRYTWFSYPYQKELKEYLYEQFKWTYNDLLSSKYFQYVVNARYYKVLEKHVTNEHIKKGFNIPIDIPK